MNLYNKKNKSLKVCLCLWPKELIECYFPDSEQGKKAEASVLKINSLDPTAAHLPFLTCSFDGPEKFQ